MSGSACCRCHRRTTALCMSWWCESADVKLVRVSMTLIDVYLWVIVGSQKETGSGISRHASKQGNLGIQTNLRCMCVCVCLCVCVCTSDCLSVCVCFARFDTLFSLGTSTPKRHCFQSACARVPVCGMTVCVCETEREKERERESMSE